MITLNDANEYLSKHIEAEAWGKLNEIEKKNSLDMAESYINSVFDLRIGTKDSPVYLHSVCEQAIHNLTFDKERLKLQREGVTHYKFDDMNFQMNNSFISPITTLLLKKHSFKKIGEII